MVQIIVGFHYHIPRGSKNDEYKKLYEESIKPSLTALYKYTKIPATLHFSGSLLYWIERNHGEIFILLNNMIRRKQIEFLSGGFYEPMMPLLSLNDRKGQIEMLTTYLRKHFGKRASGCWLPESVWESCLVSVLSACNLSWTFLDETQFADAGLKAASLYSPCITEDKGKLITIFPISSGIRARIETEGADKVLQEIANNAEKENTLYTIFPENLKNQNKDTAGFFDALSNISGKVEFILPSKIAKNVSSFQKVYFKESTVKQFLIEYPEANNIYSKITYVRMLIDQLRGDRIRKHRALEELWKAQVYDIFYKNSYRAEPNDHKDGINKLELRSAAYDAILSAEKIIRENDAFSPSLIKFDFNFDGRDDFVFRGGNINCFIRSQGASIFELDYLPKAWNYINTISADGRRDLFSEMIADTSFNAADLFNNKYSNVRRCLDEIYENVSLDRSHCKVTFVAAPNGNTNFGGLKIEKFYQFSNNKIFVNYKLTNQSSSKMNFVFIPELNLSFFDTCENYLRIVEFEKELQFKDLHNEAIISLNSDSPFSVILKHENLPHGAYQSTRIFPQKKMSIAPSICAELNFSLNIYN